MGAPGIPFTQLTKEVQTQVAQTWVDFVRREGEVVGTRAQAFNPHITLLSVIDLLRTMNKAYTANGQLLFKFCMLSSDVQQRVAEDWAKVAQDLNATDFTSSEGVVQHALVSLMTEPDHKYTADGQEI